MGALTSQPYRFRARPWDIEGAGSVCTLCPAQCNVTFTVRDERVLRVLGARQRRGRRRLAVRQGPLRLPVDPRRRAHHARRWSATAASCARSPGSARSTRPPRRSRAPSGRVGALAGGETTNEEGFLLQRLAARGPRLARPRLARRRRRCRSALHRALAAPGAAGDGRRPRVRPRRPRARLRARRRHADRRPAHPQGRAPPRRQARRRDEPPVVAGRQRGRERRASRPAPARPSLLALSAALRPAAALEAERLAQAAGVELDARARARARCCERRRGRRRSSTASAWSRARAPRHAARALLDLAGALEPRGRDGAGLLGVPASAPTAAGCARPACCPTPARASRHSSARAATPPRSPPPRAAGELTALYLLHADPLRRPARARRAGSRRSSARPRSSPTPPSSPRASASTRPSSSRPSPTPRRRDGHAPRRAPAAPARGRSATRATSRSEWQVLAELARARRPRPRRPHRRRWPPRSSPRPCPSTRASRSTRSAAGACAGRSATPPRPSRAAELGAVRRSRPAPRRRPARANGRLRLGTFRSIWAAPEVARLARAALPAPATRVELAPADAQRLELFQGDRVVVGSDGHDASTRRSPLRAATPEGSVFLGDRTRSTGPLVEVRKA